MEEIFYYFSELNSFSIQNEFILSLLSLFEALDLFIYSLSIPARLFLFNINHNSNLLSMIKKFSLHFHYLKLTKCSKQSVSSTGSSCQYPYYLYCIIILIIFLFPIVQVLFYRLRSNSKETRSKSKCSFIKSFILTFYDQIVFRSLALESFDTIIAFVIQNYQSYTLESIGLVCLSISLIISIKYLNTFRLCICFDSTSKYPFDEVYSKIFDNALFLMKIFISFETWLNYQQSDLQYIFLALNVLLLLALNLYTIVWFNCVNVYNCVRGVFFLNFFFGFLFHLFFCNLEDSWAFVAFFFSMIILIPVIIMIFLREYRINEIIKGNDIANKFYLLFYYYPHAIYDNILTKMCFSDKLVPSSLNEMKTKKALNDSISSRSEDGDMFLPKVNDLIMYMNYISEQLLKKQKLAQPLSKKEEFIYHLNIIYKRILGKESIDFSVITQIRVYLSKVLKENNIYYFNVKLFYNKLCEIDLSINNDKLQLLNCYSDLFHSMRKFIKRFNFFIDNINFADVSDYFAIGNHLNVFLKEGKINYNLLLFDNKEEYQKLIIKILLENISNRSISKCHSDLFTLEDISAFEDLLDKQYKLDNYLKIKIELKTSKSKIIKASRQLNHLYNKDINAIFPKAFYFLAKKLFLREKELEDMDIFQSNKDCEVYQFIIVDNNENIRTFAFYYKIYHNLDKDILFLEGYYSLGSEVLVITEDNGKDEFITLISKRLEFITLFDQKLIVVLKKYDMKISLKSFCEYKIFTIKKYYEYLYKILKELIEICSCDEIPYIQEVLNKLIKGESTYSEFWFNQIAKINDNSRNVVLYFHKLENFSCDVKKHEVIKKYNDYGTKRKSKKTVSKFTNILIPKVSHFNVDVFDTNSISSISSKTSSLTKLTNIKIRKKDKKMYKTNSYIIIILNLIVIVMAIFCLLYENFLNVSFSSLLKLYHTLSVINITVSHTMTSFLSLLCFSNSPKQKCQKRFLDYLSKNEQFVSLYDFTYLELITKVTYLNQQIEELKILFNEKRDRELDNIFDLMAEVCHLNFENGVFEDYDRIVDMSSVLIEFLNKMTALIDNQSLLSIDVYPIELDENFQVLSIVPGVAYLSQEQLYIYELLTKYLEYNNLFFLYQKTIESNISKNKQRNLMSLVIFIIGLVLANLFILYLFWMFLITFNKLIKAKLIKIQSILVIESNITKLKNKYIYLSDLMQLYPKNPTKIITQIIEITQKNPKIKLSNINQSEKANELDKNETNKTNKTDNEIKLNINAKDNKNIDLSFLTSYFIVVLCIFGIVYIAYCCMFYLIFEFSFNRIAIIVEILKTSTKMEEETYLSICLVHLLGITNIQSNTLFNLFFSHFNNTDDRRYDKVYESNDFFLILVNSIQVSFQKEAIIYFNDSFFVPHNSILQFNCETMYHEFNDVLYNTIFPGNKNKNYEQALINFCLSNKIVSIKNERSLLIEMHYRNMKLLSYYSDERNNKATSQPNVDEIFYLTGQFLFIFRPLRTYINNFYFNVVLKNILDNHFAYLITFLIGNIIFQIINFILFKVKILNLMEKYNKNIEILHNALKLSN